MHLAYQDARYGDVLTALPTISVQLAGTGDPRMLAAGWAVVAKMLTKTGSWDLALLAADRAREAAYRSGDRADLGMAVSRSYARCCRPREPASGKTSPPAPPTTSPPTTPAIPVASMRPMMPRCVASPVHCG